MHPNKTSVHVFILPVELYHQIIFLLDVKDILALRKTCKYFHALTQERSLWWMMFARLRATQALPCSRAEFKAMSSPQAERVLLTASKVEASFLQVRAHHIPIVRQPSSSTSTSMHSWRVLTFISDDFILSVDSTAVFIWDTTTLTSSSSVVSCSPWAHFTLSNFLGYVDCHSTLYIAVARVHVDYQSAVIYSVSLSKSGHLHLETEFPLKETESLKHMDPSSGRALLYFPPTSIHVLHWHDGNRRSTIDVESDNLGLAWNGITSLRFCGPYVLCFRVRSVEAYPIPTTAGPDPFLPILRHQFGPVCFRAVSLSHVRVSGDVYTVFLLANDVYQGMFHYRIRVTTSPAAMSVHTLGRGGIQTLNVLPLIPGTNIRYTLGDMFRLVFVSAWSLGSAGLRGVWVDRQRGSIDRRVVAFTTHPSQLRRKKGGLILGEGVVDGNASDEVSSIDGQVVHVISSYDLRDDITICAVSEWTGRIALGSRVGTISLL